MNELYILITKNNTIATFSINNKVIFCKSVGNLKFKGAKKSTPFASQKLIEFVCEKIRKFKKKIYVKIKGNNSNRESVFRALSSAKLNIFKISDITSFPHNGCRPKKIRRI
ncbi:small ribosomal subunit protein uS11 [Candidatus Vidania fulgoroideorum]